MSFLLQVHEKWSRNNNYNSIAAKQQQQQQQHQYQTVVLYQKDNLLQQQQQQPTPPFQSQLRVLQEKRSHFLNSSFVFAIIAIAWWTAICARIVRRRCDGSTSPQSQQEHEERRLRQMELQQRAAITTTATHRQVPSSDPVRRRQQQLQKLQMDSEIAQLRRQMLMQKFRLSQVQTKLQTNDLQVEDKNGKDGDTTTTIDDGNLSTCSDQEDIEQQQEEPHQQRQTVIVLEDRAGRKPLQTPTVPNNCAICLDCYRVGEHLVWSSNPSCSHAFHEDCILDYLVKLPATPDDILSIRDTPCPCCRRNFCISDTPA